MKLIDKDVLVAEIKRIKEMYCYDTKTNASFVAEAVINSINNAIDTLEVKEVDLDFQWFAKEIDEVFDLPSEVTTNTEEEPLNWEYAIAKHFFELGLKAQKGE